MTIETPGLHHLALRVTELHVSRHFYGTTLGFPVILEGPGLFLFLAGRTAVAVREADEQTPVGDAFDPHRVGLDHLAIGCSTEQDLRRVAAALAQAGVPNTGIKVDPTLDRAYVAFKDPDGIAWEYYMAPDTTREAVRTYFDSLTRERLEMLPLSSRIDLHHIVADGEHAAAHYTVDTAEGRVSGCDFFRVVNGEVVEARRFHAPWPPLAASQPAGAASYLPGVR